MQSEFKSEESIDTRS